MDTGLDLGDGLRAPVTLDDPLRATEYRYVPPPVTIQLSRICVRERKSATSAGGNGAAMAKLVKERDQRCWISSQNYPAIHLINSHICPKRMGDHLARHILHEFSAEPNPTEGIYDPVFGISLFPALDPLFDNFEIGFRRDCHGLV